MLAEIKYFNISRDFLENKCGWKKKFFLTTDRPKKKKNEMRKILSKLPFDDGDFARLSFNDDRRWREKISKFFLNGFSRTKKKTRTRARNHCGVYYIRSVVYTNSGFFCFVFQMYVSHKNLCI